MGNSAWFFEYAETVGKRLVRYGLALAHLGDYREAVRSYNVAVHVYRLLGKVGVADKFQGDTAAIEQDLS